MIWLGILFWGLFHGFGPFVVGHRRPDARPTTVSVYSNGIPLVSVLIGWFLLSLRHVTGGLTLLLGSWFARTDRIHRGKEKLGPPES